MLTAISPIDGRYRRHIEALADYFSEQALIAYRVRVEIEYLIALSHVGLPKLKPFSHTEEQSLKQLYQQFTEADAQRVKTIETTTNHDVKAVEYFIKEKLETLNLSDCKEYVHFGLTSQDINNTAQPLMLRDALNHVYLPMVKLLVHILHEKALQWSEVAMLAHTHGQPASPTRLGKELEVFVERLNIQLTTLEQIPCSAKFGGATGNFNAHHVAFPDIDWVIFANQFVAQTLGLERSQTTTQIEHYDNLAALLDALKRINTIWIDFCRDMWTYISMNYFQQTVNANEVGSSAMPHKINPIDFENAEGNLGLANAIFEHLSGKLPISRLQRDLTDSTVMRNVGVPIAHTLIAMKSLEKGIGKLVLNKSTIEADLDHNWAVVAEAIQTILRVENYPNPYETLKQLTRKNQAITQQTIAEFIETLDVNVDLKKRLLAITPHNYTGINLLGAKH
ncbi:adenylosuccinate lyase [Bacteroidia bacterium]|nr:adenylosuccinate lyase [Bacteroidia bacterium]